MNAEALGGTPPFVQDGPLAAARHWGVSLATAVLGTTGCAPAVWSRPDLLCINEVDLPAAPRPPVSRPPVEVTAMLPTRDGGVDGVVRSATRGEPVVQATLVLHHRAGSTQRVTTTAGGRFALMPASGQVVLETRAIGYVRRLDTLDLGEERRLTVMIPLEAQFSDGPGSGFAMICEPAPRPFRY